MSDEDLFFLKAQGTDMLVQTNKFQRLVDILKIEERSRRVHDAVMSILQQVSLLMKSMGLLHYPV